MIVVIQCAASKRPNAGHLVTISGKLVEFVAYPELAPRSTDRVFERPDDLREDGASWRTVLLNYNQNVMWTSGSDFGKNSLRRRAAIQDEVGLFEVVPMLLR